MTILKSFSYQYGLSATRLMAYAIAALVGAIGSYVMIRLEPAPGQFWQRDWRAYVFWLTLPGLAVVSLYYFTLLVKRFASPTFIVLDDAAITIPKTSLTSQTRTIEFAEISKLVGPRAGKFELRTAAEPVCIEALKLATTEAFVGLCQQIVDRCGLKRDLAAEAKHPPKYIEISKSFTIGRMSSYYGSVIISRRAIFFLQLKNANYRYKAVAEGIAQAIEKVGGKQIAEVPITELDDAILDHHDWPLWDNEGTVRVLPRSAVTSVRLPWWGALSIRAGDRRFSSSVPFWKSLRVKRQLREAGWPLDGEQREPP
ncbi:hypothetical protein [Lacipirellula parvula]|uniref:Uncharacterized protein n=1 Tax=Lacipirellula parvula TaxID=2650471 RepID=A0A5K7XET4_9BACT|nr:hypothetical protein [Lacipirellula parvula]BBO31509.1 hypothetical protein PLANPX_1121 [Lacipirellula parvula]